MYFPLFVGVCVCLCFGIHSSFVTIFTRKRELVALLLLSFGCLVALNVFVALLHGAVVWSAVCDCGMP